RTQPHLGVGDALLDGADAGRGVDEGLVELAAVFADGVDLVLELARAFQRLLLVGAQRVEFLVTLPERFRIGPALCAGGASARYRAQQADSKRRSGAQNPARQRGQRWRGSGGEHGGRTVLATLN